MGFACRQKLRRTNNKYIVLYCYVIYRDSKLKTINITRCAPGGGSHLLNWLFDYYSFHTSAYIFYVAHLLSQNWITASKRLFNLLNLIYFLCLAGAFYGTEPGMGRIQSHSEAAQHTRTWLDNYTQKYADKLPNTEKLHLPSCLTRHDVYAMCRSELEDSNFPYVSESHFYLLWRQHYKHVVIPKVTMKRPMYHAFQDHNYSTIKKLVKLAECIMN